MLPGYPRASFIKHPRGALFPSTNRNEVQSVVGFTNKAQGYPGSILVSMLLQGESHVSRGPILLLGNSICPMSRFAECSNKSKKKHIITPHIVSLGRLWLVQNFEAVPHEWKSFVNPSDAQQRYNKYLTNLVFSVHTVSYRSLFFPPTIYGLYTSHLSHKSKGKKLGP